MLADQVPLIETTKATRAAYRNGIKKFHIWLAKQPDSLAEEEDLVVPRDITAQNVKGYLTYMFNEGRNKKPVFAQARTHFRHAYKMINAELPQGFNELVDEHIADINRRIDIKALRIKIKKLENDKLTAAAAKTPFWFFCCGP